MTGLPPDVDGVNYTRPLKVTKAKRFKKRVVRYVLSGIKAFKASGKRQAHVFGQGLLFKQRQYNHFY
jgi:hypothetical protein